MLGVLKKLFDSNERELRRLEGMVAQVNELEPEVQDLDDEALRAKTDEFRSRLDASGPRDDLHDLLDDLMPDAFAVCREAARRTLGERPYDVQVMGAIVLHEGKIAEMKTGEGKTLAATMPAYLNALAGRGVHVVTVNDYLAQRDAEWMGQVYRFLGLEVGSIVSGMDQQARQEAYRADITYGTNNEFGFDYLRDNMVVRRRDQVQRGGHFFAIIDEVDSILIDEARTPLIISGRAEESTDMFQQFARIAVRLKPEKHFEVDEKARNVTTTEEGIAQVEKRLGIENLYDAEHMDLSHYLNQALKARVLFKRDRDYVVRGNGQNKEVIIVDEFTGRLMEGRRYSDGLHQAIEAKEGVEIRQQTQTLASITFQNFFRMYEKLAGMTGTAKTEEDEFLTIYNLAVVVIPTNEPMIREDRPDKIYTTEKAKFKAVADEIADLYAEKRPVLVGTPSIEESERLSAELKRRGIPHEVLNAKYHEREAEIVAKAGQQGSVTIATNMAGRGTDIKLGEGVVDLGGLHIIGTSRHDSRRIDNQLRGRAGRQGDAGSSRFYVSLDDEIMRRFGTDNVRGLLDRVGMDEGEAIEHNLITRAIENAQKKVESRNFDIRKQILKYDDVMNHQRKVIYEQRQRVLMEEDLREHVVDNMLEDVVDALLDQFCLESEYPEDWDLEGLLREAQALFLPPDTVVESDIRGLGRGAVKEDLLEAARSAYEEKEDEVGPEVIREFERVVVLRVVDQKWMDHLSQMDALREGISLRAYGREDPLVEYHRESHEMFQQMIHAIKEDVIKYAFKVDIVVAPERQQVAAGGEERRASLESFGLGQRPQATSESGGGGPQTKTKLKPVVKDEKEKIGRNDPCHCGSGVKYKYCHGR